VPFMPGLSWSTVIIGMLASVMANDASKRNDER
jgi:hypothetical protein